MPNEIYTVRYFTGRVEYFYCTSFQETIIRALALAYDKDIDLRIINITNAKGEKVIRPHLIYTKI